MDPRALGEALLAVAATPIISAVMALSIVAAMLFVLRKADHR